MEGVRRTGAVAWLVRPPWCGPGLLLIMVSVHGLTVKKWVVRCNRFRFNLQELTLGTDDQVEPYLRTRTPRMPKTEKKRVVHLEMGE